MGGGIGFNFDVVASCSFFALSIAASCSFFALSIAAAISVPISNLESFLGLPDVLGKTHTSVKVIPFLSALSAVTFCCRSICPHLS